MRLLAWNNAFWKFVENPFDRVILISFFVEPACGERDIVVTTALWRMLHVHASVRIFPGHNFYMYGRVSKGLFSLMNRCAI